MIDQQTFSKDWIKEVSLNHGKADPILVEKAIRALYLVEQLKVSGLDFIFKGGTALFLTLPNPNRLSIDIDIIIPYTTEIDSFLKQVINQSGFTDFEKQERKINSGINKAHYKFFYQPVTYGKSRQEAILLDILYETSPYGKHLTEEEIVSDFIKATGTLVKVRMPTFEALTGDKLTAYAPNTTGIPYGVGKEIEIIKQLYDIGNLFDQISDMAAVRDVFYDTAKQELKYRSQPGITENDVLDDIIQTSFCIATKGKEGVGKFDNLQRGISNIGSYIFSESFHLEKAMFPAAKAAYLASLIKSKSGNLQHFYNHREIVDWQITLQPWNKLNKLKKTHPEAFYFWYKALDCITPV